MNLFFRIKRRISRIIRQLYHPCGVILMLHRVIEEKNPLKDNRKLEVTPDFLEQTILKYKNAGYRLASLDDVQQQMQEGKRSKKKFVCFTLDDGYADNYELAYPVFKKHNCPFAIYITTDFPDRKMLFWWYHLQDAVLENEKLLFNGVEYDCSDMEKKNQAFIELKEFFIFDSEMTPKILEQLFAENAITTRRDTNMLPLSWEQISDLATDPLCTIGAHTVSHTSLITLTDDEIRKELADGKKKIEERIKKPVRHFSYPYGISDERVKCLAMEYYSTAVKASNDIVRNGDSLYNLERILLQIEMETKWI